MIVKSSFSTNGKRGGRNIGYINREGSFEGGRAAVLDRDGDTLHRSDFRELRQAIKEAPIERRLIFSPKDPEVSREDIGIMVRDVIERYQTHEHKNFEYVYAVHDHNERTHAHVLCWGDRADLKMDKGDLAFIRDMAQELEIQQEKIIDFDITKEETLEKGDYSKLEKYDEMSIEVGQ